MTRLRYNGLTATLGSALAASDTSVTFAAVLTSASGAVPTIAAGDYIALSILDASGNVAEIVHLTAYAAGATTGTIARAQEGTTAAAHASGATVVHSATVEDFRGPKTINAQAGTAYTLALTDAGAFVTLTNAAAITLTVPPSSAVVFDVGTVIEGAQLGAGQVTIAADVGVTIHGDPGLKVAAQYGTFGLLYLGSDTWLAFGRLAA